MRNINAFSFTPIHFSIMLSHSHTNFNILHTKLMRRMSQGSICERMNSYLPGVGVYSDHEGCSPSMSLYHCTTIEMTAAITQHLSNSFAQFLVVGACVRACPFHNNKHKKLNILKSVQQF